MGVPAGCVLLVLGFAEHECLADAVALSGELDESSVVNDAVDDRGGEFVVGEDRAPFAELDVRGEDDAPSLVAAGDDLVEQSGAVDVEGHVAELVQDDQIGFGDVLEHGLEGSLALGAAQLKDELGGGQEPHVHAPVDRAHAQRGGQVGLAASGLPVEHEVLGPADEVQGEQLVPGVPVGQLHVREVVAVQRLGDREPGAAQEPGALRGLAVVQFRVQQPVDGLELPGRGPCQQVVDGGLGDEQGAGPRPQPVDVRTFLVPLARTLSSLPANARSYSVRSTGSS